MALVMTQEGALRIMQWFLGVFPPVIPNLHLFGVAFTPHETNRVSDFAANEVTPGQGYAALPLSSPRAGWTLAEITAGAQGQYQTVSWTFTAATNVYGYYLSDDTLPVSLWAEAFGTPFLYPSGGVFAMNPFAQLVNAAGVS